MPSLRNKARFGGIPLCIKKIAGPGKSKGFISDIYLDLCGGSIECPESLKSRGKWEEDLGAISDGQWRKVLERGHLVSVSPTQVVSFLMLVHRPYYTPKRMFEFG